MSGHTLFSCTCVQQSDSLPVTLVNEILSKERTESPVSPQEGKSAKGNPEVVLFFQ